MVETISGMLRMWSSNTSRTARQTAGAIRSEKVARRPSGTRCRSSESHRRSCLPAVLGSALLVAVPWPQPRPRGWQPSRRSGGRRTEAWTRIRMRSRRTGSYRTAGAAWGGRRSPRQQRWGRRSRGRQRMRKGGPIRIVAGAGSGRLRSCEHARRHPRWRTPWRHETKEKAACSLPCLLPCTTRKRERQRERASRSRPESRARRHGCTQGQAGRQTSSKQAVVVVELSPQMKENCRRRGQGKTKDKRLSRLLVLGGRVRSWRSGSSLGPRPACQSGCGEPRRPG